MQPLDIEKLALIRNIARTLAEQSLYDVNLILHELQIVEIRAEAWESRSSSSATGSRTCIVIEKIRDLSPSAIDDLAHSVRELFGIVISVESKRATAPLQLFASHLTTQKALVGQVGEYLHKWGVSLFVAHTDIEPDTEWQREIERVLDSCDAGVVFFSPKFIESRWCDQEVGWLMGRQVPCYSLRFNNETPYGPLGKKQAYSVTDGMTAASVGEEIIRWISQKPELTTGFAASLVEALKNSDCFRQTDKVWDWLQNAKDLGKDSVASLLSAIRDNDQVYRATRASKSGREERDPYAELAFKLATKQPGFTANIELATEVAKIRGLDALLGGAAAES
ncbi:toll/interleukin-1 receptor domain-containing protein [Bifidobacterium sp.]|uniref:toll/interleukin-1 receptor domain-containing protein n=1 Tax=Bifidobacterium sp. TaxID=41200 RepID=UPI0039E8468E